MAIDLNYIPNGWRKIKISEKLFFQEGPGVRKWQFTKSGIKLLNVGNINGGVVDLTSTDKHLSIEEANGKYSHFLVDEGDLLIACSGIVVDNFHNKIAFAEDKHLPLCLNTSTMRFKSLGNDLDLNYFKYFLQTKHFTSQLQKLITGSAQLNFGPSHIKKIDFLYPPLPEQQRIAQILDNAAALRDKTKQLLTEYDSLAQSIFLDMFGDPVTNPKGWEISSLEDVSIKINDGTHHSPKLVNKGFPYVTAKHIKIEGLNFEAKPTFVDEKAHEEIYTRCRPEFNDVLLIKDGATTGVACLNTFKIPISLLSSVGLIKPNKEVLNPVFLVFWFNHLGVKEDLIRKFMSGAAIKRYTLSKIKRFELIVPQIEFQNQFAEKIASIEEQKELAKQELQEAENLFNGLLQKAFKGEL